MPKCHRETHDLGERGAPVRLGDGAFIAAGSVVTRDVAADAMAFGRAQQVDKPGRAKAFRAGKEKK